jgi:alpha-glucosidase
MSSLSQAVIGGALLWVCAGCGGQVSETAWRIDSPEGKVGLEIAVLEPDTPEAALHYRVLLQGPTGSVPALDWSPLGIRRADQDLATGLKVLSASPAESLDERYELPHGKQRQVRARSRQLTLGLTASGGAAVEVIFRVSDQGVAFRYRFPESDGKLYTVIAEDSGFRIPAGAFGYLTPHQAPSRYTPAYEAGYVRDVAAGTPAPTEEGWSYPALFRLPGAAGWVLLTEADLDSSYCGTRLAPDAADGVYRIRFPSAGEGQGIGDVLPVNSLPWATPWRVVLAAATVGEIVESTWVTDLSRPGPQIPEWVRPGRVAWSWWSDPDSPKQFARQLTFVDLAGEMGWEYLLVDANWDEMGDDAIPQLVEYARAKGVKVLLWYNSGGPHNTVTEKPRDRMFEGEARRKEMQWMNQVGIAGIKVDFFQSDKQDTIRLYEDILKDAGESRIMVNFHGCTVPRGWERTYPHLMSMEAVRATECYIYDPAFPEEAASHQAMLPFTRNVVGPMDYTPVALSDQRYPRLTTAAHELALSVLFTSGWVHFADGAEAYRSLPEAPRQFLRSVPAAWDETRFLAGEPGQYVALARRSGDSWYLAAINGENAAITVPFFLNFLAGSGVYRGEVISDGQQRSSLTRQDLAVRSGDRLSFDLPPRGGLVIRLEPEG